MREEPICSNKQEKGHNICMLVGTSAEVVGRLKKKMETWFLFSVRMMASADVIMNLGPLGPKFYYAWNPEEKSSDESNCIKTTLQVVD